MSIHKVIRYVGFLAIVGEGMCAQTRPYSGLVDATQFAGVDVGDKVNAAIASLGSGACGTIAVPHGDCALSKKIVKPRCIMLDFQNSTVPSTITNGPSIVAGSFLDTSAMDWKMIYAPNEDNQAMLMPWSSVWPKTERRFVIFSTLRSCLPR